MSEGALCVLVLSLKLPLNSSSLLPTNERHNNQKKGECHHLRREGEKLNVLLLRDKRRTHPVWAPSRPWSSCSDPAEPSALLFACPVTSKTYFGFFVLSESVAAVILKCSDLFLIGSQQRLHPLFQPLVFLVWPNKRDVKMLFSCSHSPRDRWIFWHVMECLATDATAMLIWTNKQSKPTVTAPPRATNLQLAWQRGGCWQTQQPFSSVFNLYNPEEGFARQIRQIRRDTSPTLFHILSILTVKVTHKGR